MNEPKSAIPSLSLIYLFSEVMNTVGRRASQIAQEKGEPITVQEFAGLVNFTLMDALLALKPEDEVAQLTLCAEYGAGLWEFIHSLDDQIDIGAARFGFGTEPRDEGEPLH